MRTISVDSLKVLASIGILEHELSSKQPLLISMSVDMASAPVLPSCDEVTQVLDYRRLRDIGIREAQSSHINMLETLAGRIATSLLALPGVDSSRVRVAKPNVFPDCDGVAVEVRAHRPQSPKESPALGSHGGQPQTKST